MGATEIGSKMFTTGSLKEYIPSSADAFNLYLTNQKSKILDIVKNAFVTAIESGVKPIDESVPVGLVMVRTSCGLTSTGRRLSSRTRATRPPLWRVPSWTTC